ncbi:hypothetical protein [Salmonella enterica]|uniref:hypothetical protein n=1 Tax=Salmonella enterica TaxID=28901 RepID=UPI0003EB5580|nr:hypothetical protein [Salmonella enterica]
MKEVKIYTIVSDQLSPPITGESFCTDMVRHSDYAELEAKYAALAEVRAQGVEMFGSATIKFGEEEGDEDIVYAGNQALLFAAQLRKGAAL